MNKVIQELEEISVFQSFEYKKKENIKSPFIFLLQTNKVKEQRNKFIEYFKIDPMIYNISEGLFKSLPRKEKAKLHYSIYSKIKENKNYNYVWNSLVLNLLYSMKAKKTGVENILVKKVLLLYIKKNTSSQEVLETLAKIKSAKKNVDKDFFMFIHYIVLSLRDSTYTKPFFEMSYMDEEKREKLALYYATFIIKELQ